MMKLMTSPTTESRTVALAAKRSRPLGMPSTSEKSQITESRTVALAAKQSRPLGMPSTSEKSQITKSRAVDLVLNTKTLAPAGSRRDRTFRFMSLRMILAFALILCISPCSCSGVQAVSWATDFAESEEESQQPLVSQSMTTHLINIQEEQNRLVSYYDFVAFRTNLSRVYNILDELTREYAELVENCRNSAKEVPEEKRKELLGRFKNLITVIGPVMYQVGGEIKKYRKAGQDKDTYRVIVKVAKIAFTVAVLVARLAACDVSAANLSKDIASEMDTLFADRSGFDSATWESTGNLADHLLKNFDFAHGFIDATGESVKKFEKFVCPEISPEKMDNEISWWRSVKKTLTGIVKSDDQRILHKMQKSRKGFSEACNTLKDEDDYFRHLETIPGPIKKAMDLFEKGFLQHVSTTPAVGVVTRACAGTGCPCSNFEVFNEWRVDVDRTVNLYMYDALKVLYAQHKSFKIKTTKRLERKLDICLKSKMELAKELADPLREIFNHEDYVIELNEELPHYDSLKPNLFFVCARAKKDGAHHHVPCKCGLKKEEDGDIGEKHAQLFEGKQSGFVHCECGGTRVKRKCFSIVPSNKETSSMDSNATINLDGFRRRLPALVAEQNLSSMWFTPSVIICTVLTLVNVLLIAAVVCVLLRSNGNKEKRRRSDLRARDSTWSEVVSRVL